MTASTKRPLAFDRRTLAGGAAAMGAAFLAPSLASAQTPEPESNIDLALATVDDLVTGIMEATGVPGVAVGVVYQDQVVHLAGYGVRETGTTDPIDPDTVFQLASVSKGMSATTVAAVVGDGAASWDDLVHDSYPLFALSEAWTTHEATVRDLFCHRSGLPEHAGDLLEDIGFSKEAMIERLRFYNPAGSFRAHYDYTNAALSAAAYSVAAKVGIDWNDLAWSRLYEPLGMTSTSSRFDDYIAQENRAIPHMQVEPGVWAFVEQRQPDAQTPAGGVSSSARDMMQYLRLLLGGGSVDGEEIIANAALAQTLVPHMISSPVADPSVQRTGFYGLGWNVGVNGLGQPSFNHSGAFSLGAATFAAFNPSEEVGIVVLTNGAPIGVPESIGLTFLDYAILGQAPIDYLPLLQVAFAESLRPFHDRGIDFSVQPEGFSESAPLASYTGDYASDLWGIAGVREENGGLMLELGPNRTAYAMTHYDGNQFTFQPPGENGLVPSLVKFAIGADETAESVTIDYLDREGQGTLARAETDA